MKINKSDESEEYARLSEVCRGHVGSSLFRCHPIGCKSFSNQFGFHASSFLHAHDNIGNQSNVDGEEYGMTLSQQLSDWNYEGVSPQSKEDH
jgi:hypothetical protein